MKGRMLKESEGYDLLAAFGVPVPGYRIVSGEAEAAAAAEAIGYPVVMKVVSAQVVHKSDAGGVVTGITGGEALKEAYASMIRTVRERVPGAVIDGVIIEQEMPPGLELIIGGKTDPTFGRVITFGMGGTLVELMKDVAIRVLPLTDEELRDMVRSIRGYRLISGFRGRAPRDEEALVQALRNVCTCFCERPEIREFDINPLILYETGACAVDARIITDEDDPGRPAPSRKRLADPSLFSPASIALIGASSNPNKIGYAIFRNLLSFEGTTYPINPNANELFGRRVYASIADLPERVDMAVIAVPAGLVPAVMEEVGRAGVRLAAIISAGFRETGEEGRMLEEAVIATAAKYGVRILGPNCLGIMLPHRNLNATFDPASPRPGPIAFISQSGAVITTMVDWSLAEDIGISAVISIGNQADLDFEDFIQFAQEDRDTKTIVLYIEEIRNGRQFLDYARKVSGKKPIVAIKSGSSVRGRKAASSHTGSLAGSYEVYRAAFRQAGVIAAHSLREAFDVAGLLASEGYPRGPRAVILTSAGGFAVLSSDYAEENGIELIEFSPAMMRELDAFLPGAWSGGNPLDMVGDAGVDRFAKVFDVMIRHQEEWDIAFVVSVPSVSLDPIHLAKEIVRFSTHTRKMVVGCLLGGESMRAGVRLLRNAHIPNFTELEDAFRAVGIALDRKEWLIGEQGRQDECGWPRTPGSE
jgi:acetyl coenzyme A synthetase (ADP forming)-like protein